MLKAIDVGNHLVIAGSIKETGVTVDGSSSSSLKLVTTLTLPNSNIKSVSTTAAADAAAARDSNPTVPTSSSAAAAAADQETMNLISRYNDVFKLLGMLKDGLCLPLLVAAAAAARLPAPVGLNSLHFELQEAVLQLLQAHDLASLCCTCTFMRHRAATDTLWKTLLDRSFFRTSLAALAAATMSHNPHVSSVVL